MGSVHFDTEQATLWAVGCSVISAKTARNYEVK